MIRTLTNTFSRGVILACATFLGACGAADISAPSATVQGEAQTALGTVTIASVTSTTTERLASVRALGRMIPLGHDIIASKVIGPEGGTIALNEAGFTLVVPRGAVDAPTSFSVTALRGNAIAYDFAPHGVSFKKPLQFQQNLGKSTWLPGLTLGGGYFKARSQVDTDLRRATIDEQLPATVKGGTVVLDLWHFSGYLVSMG